MYKFHNGAEMGVISERLRVSTMCIPLTPKNWLQQSTFLSMRTIPDVNKDKGLVRKDLHIESGTEALRKQVTVNCTNRTTNTEGSVDQDNQVDQSE